MQRAAFRDHFSEGDVVLRKYRIVRRLGHGGMGVVYLAHHLILDQDVALKILSADQQSQRQRLAAEAKSIARIRSPHVVRVLDVDETQEGQLFLVMDFLEGRDLGKILAEEGPLSVERAVDFVLQAAQGLAAAHALGIVHRDLKPGNLMLTKTPQGEERIVLLDFGIAKSSLQELPVDMRLTKDMTLLGSPAYSAPEQLHDASKADAKSDVWSLGVTLHELLTGELPFGGQNVSAITASITRGSFEPPSVHNTSVSQEIDEIVKRCLRPDPAERFPTVAAFCAALSRFSPQGQGAERLHAVDVRPPPAVGFRLTVDSPSASGTVLKGQMPTSVEPDEPQRRLSPSPKRDSTPPTPLRVEETSSVVEWSILVGVIVVSLAILAWSLSQQRESRPDAPDQRPPHIIR